MHSDEDSFFYEIQPSTSGITLSHINNKSSVLCPETQNVTSQYLALQQLNAHQKMISRAKGVVDTSAPKSMQNYRSVSSQQKQKMMKHLKNNPQGNFPSNIIDGFNEPSSSRLGGYYSEEDANGSLDMSLQNKAIQTGSSVPNFSYTTAEKISWYLEALSLGELQSDYFTFLNHNCNHTKQLQTQQCSNKQSKKKIVKGDIMDWHREHFMEPNKPFSPRILDNPFAKSKVRNMRCYNPPFRREKMKSSRSYDTFESYEEEEESNHVNENSKSSDISSEEEETLINKRVADDVVSHYSHHSSIPLVPPYRRDYSNHTDPSLLNRNEEDKYLDFLSKVTEDILRSGVFSDKAIRQAFEFHLQFHKDDTNKEKMQSLLEQVLEGLKVTNDDAAENFQPRRSFVFSLNRPNSPPEKETSGALNTSESNQTVTDLNATGDESTIDKELDNS